MNTHLLQKIKAFLCGREALIFLLFVGVSAGFWFFQHLHRKHEYLFRVPLAYRNVPLCCVSADDLPSDFEVALRDEGMMMLSYRIGGLDTVVVDLSRYYREGTDRLTVPVHHLSTELRRQLKGTTEITKLSEGQFVVPVSEQQRRELPVKLNAEITYRQQHLLSGEINLEPNVVTVYGPKSIVDKLAFVETQHAELRELSQTTELLLALKKPKSVSTEPKEVRIHIPVDTFTEQTVEVPVTGRNVPSRVQVVTFPATVRVTCFAGLTHLSEVGAGSFEVSFDYNELLANASDRIRLTVMTKNPYLANVRLSPEEVEYLIEK